MLFTGSCFIEIAGAVEAGFPVYDLYARSPRSYDKAIRQTSSGNFVDRDNSRWQSDSRIFIMKISRTFSAAFAKSHPPARALNSAWNFLNVSLSRCFRP